MDQHARERFDGLLEEVLAGLPPSLHALLEEVPLIVEDRPSRQQAEELAAELGDTTAEALMEELCGLHSGPMLTERSVEELPDVPENVMLFREGIVAIAGGWAAGDDAVREEIRITVLHEIGHHFGLEEEDLEELGYE